MKKENAIEVKNMTKTFKLFYDKPSTLKERLVFWNHKKAETRTVLDNINLDIKKGETVGYDGNFKADKDELIGIVPIGYADGIIKKNTGRYVYINNNKYKIVGNICMDMLFVLIDNTIKINDEVLIIKDNNHINEIAKHLDTINYEVMCNISSRVERKYIER